MLKRIIYIFQILAIAPFAYVYFAAALHIIEAGPEVLFESYNFLIVVFILPFSIILFFVALLLAMLSVSKSNIKNNIGIVTWFIAIGIHILSSFIVHGYYRIPGTAIFSILFEAISDAILILIPLVSLIHNIIKLSLVREEI
jgi:hypothetical protein